jgi:seryl-tRNA synthetase
MRASAPPEISPADRQIAVLMTRHCLSCHIVDGYGGKDGPELSRAGRKMDAAKIQEEDAAYANRKGFSRHAPALPLYTTAYCASYRREAGAAGRDTRGMVRVHQFDKVECVKIVAPETSYDEHEKLARDVADIFEALELPYRVLLLCSGDMSFTAAKCYDFEVWSPGTQTWLECSSCSNFEDFQARRMAMRFRREAGAKVEFPHTLNASGVALPRTFATLLENHQQADGSVVIPKALRPYLGGLEVLKPGA